MSDENKSLEAVEQPARRAFVSLSIKAMLAAPLVSFPSLGLAGCGDDGPGTPEPTDDQARASEAALLYFDGDESGQAAALGTVYVEELESALEGSTETDLADLVEWILTYETAQEAADALEEKVQEDFEMGNVYTLKGWTLGLTELRLCALCALVDA